MRNNKKKVWYLKIAENLNPWWLKTKKRLEAWSPSIFNILTLYLILEVLHLLVFDPSTREMVVLFIRGIQSQTIKNILRQTVKLILRTILLYSKFKRLPWKSIVYTFLDTWFLPAVWWYTCVLVFLEYEGFITEDFVSEIDRYVYLFRSLVLVFMLLVHFAVTTIKAVFFFILVITEKPIRKKMLEIFPDEDNRESKETRILKNIYLILYICITAYQIFIVITGIRKGSYNYIFEG